MTAPDLTKQPPRSARTRLGGYALLPRMLDKCRATLAGLNGEYHYACPLDQHILEFLGIDPEALKTEVATGKGDGEILTWIRANQAHKHAGYQISAWSLNQDSTVPTDAGTREFFNGLHTGAGPDRDDIATWADVLDLDDYVTFGGKA